MTERKSFYSTDLALFLKTVKDLHCLPHVPSGLYLRRHGSLRLGVQFKSCKSSECVPNSVWAASPPQQLTVVPVAWCFSLCWSPVLSSSPHPQPSEYSWYSSCASSTRSSPVVSTVEPLPPCTISANITQMPTANKLLLAPSQHQASLLLGAMLITHTKLTTACFREQYRQLTLKCVI